jgi:hypothetical protein
LSYQHIYFAPWRGAEYDKGGLLGRKVLIVGESHYDEWDEDDGRGMVKHELSRSFTQECVQEIVDGEKGARYWNTVRNRLGGAAHEVQPSSTFWNKVAFYNLIQSPVEGGPRRRPTYQQWIAAAPALIEAIAMLRPDRVVFTGLHLWWHVPPRDEKLRDITIEGDERKIPLETFIMADGKRVFVTRTAHPSSSQFERWLTPLLHEFLVQDWESATPSAPYPHEQADSPSSTLDCSPHYVPKSERTPILSAEQF